MQIKLFSVALMAAVTCGAAQAVAHEVPVGTEVDVRLQTTLDSGKAEVEDRFEATTIVDIKVGADVVVPAGSIVRGMVSAVEPAGRLNRRGSLTLIFDRITVAGRNYDMKGTATEVFESEGITEERGRIGAGAGAGAVVGGIIGGLRGALIGAVIGTGGTIAAMPGRNVELPAGTIVRVRIDTPIEVR